MTEAEGSGSQFKFTFEDARGPDPAMIINELILILTIKHFHITVILQNTMAVEMGKIK